MEVRALSGKKGEARRVSCAGCHIPRSGFSDTRSLGAQISLAAGWGRRRTPSLLDVAQGSFLMWDGSKDSLQSQIFGPLENAAEMNSSRLFMAEQIFERYRTRYESLFGKLPPLSDVKRFPRLGGQTTGCAPGRPFTVAPCPASQMGTPGDHGDFDRMAPGDRDEVTRVVLNAGRAIAAYERRLSCGLSKFDAWIHGDSEAISVSAQRGARLFVGAGRCVSCHSGPFLTDEAFHNIGLFPKAIQHVFNDFNDMGLQEGEELRTRDPLRRGGGFVAASNSASIPLQPSPKLGLFKTSSLRCVALRPSFFHTGQVRSLDEAVAFFDKGGDPGAPGRSEILALHLSAQDRADLVEFLKSLVGPGPPAELLRGD